MDSRTLLLIEERFRAFASAFLGDDPLVQANITLKRDHSLAVRDLAMKILERTDMSPSMENLALCGALLHDTGRFPQFAGYRTFHDGSSVDHGELGAQVLDDSILQGALTPDERTVIHQVVRYHNKRAIPSGLAPGAREILAIVRDADKLDILRIMADHFHAAGTSDTSLVLHLPDNGGYTPGVYEAVMDGTTVINDMRKNVTDMKLGYLAWVYDLNHDISVRILHESGVLGRLASTLPDNMDMTRLVECIQGYCRERLGGSDPI